MFALNIDPARPDDAPDALDGYAARVAQHGAGEAVVDAELPAECPDGFMLLCAPLCTSDLDCIAGVERCVALTAVQPAPVEATEAAPEPVYVDDVPTVLGQTEEEAGDKATIVALCDPFFDTSGAVSADLVSVVGDEGE